ncbi:hypothetical protein HYV11_01445 [Candidatus Dependentiae bacterium]|nr:hypothetical protein [Candidatus Dependentiae bacterium]
MKVIKSFLLLWIITCFYHKNNTAPIVQKIVNNTDIGYVIIYHNDQSPCSFQNLNKTIDARSVFHQEFLLERHKKHGQSSLTLRPLYYYDALNQQKYLLLDKQLHFDDKKIYAAYHAWKKNNFKRKFNSALDWLQNWIGNDLLVIPNVFEALGYLIFFSRIHVKNDIKKHAQWLSFSKGIFSRLVIEIDLVQHPKKGISPTLKTIAGEGGICLDGSIDRL